MDVNITLEKIKQLLSQLPEGLLVLIQAAGSVAANQQFSAYLVGGFVRDLLLGAPNLDLDFVVEGNAVAVARAMAARFGGDVLTYERFGTATWSLEDSAFAKGGSPLTIGLVDFITTRREEYAYPGALPDVEPGTIRQDLERRDFTINTLAICLDDASFGQLLDLFDGLKDLRAGLIRVLHDLSFSDDPTRILRAVRYEQRYGFQIEPHTSSMIDGALEVIARVSGQRLRNELFLIFAASAPEKSLQRLAHLNVLQAIHPDLNADGETNLKFARLREARGQPEPLAYLGALVHLLPYDSVVSLAHRLNLTNDETEFIANVNRLNQLEPELSARGLAPSEVARLLGPFSADSLSVAAALTENPIVRERIERYQSQWQAIKPLTDGNRLKELGIAPGPIYRKILERLRDARLNGEISTQAEEEQLALQLAEQQGA